MSVKSQSLENNNQSKDVVGDPFVVAFSKHIEPQEVARSIKILENAKPFKQIEDLVSSKAAHIEILRETAHLRKKLENAKPFKQIEDLLPIIAAHIEISSKTAHLRKKLENAKPFKQIEDLVSSKAAHIEIPSKMAELIIILENTKSLKPIEDLVPSKAAHIEIPRDKFYVVDRLSAIEADPDKDKEKLRNALETVLLNQLCKGKKGPFLDTFAADMKEKKRAKEVDPYAYRDKPLYTLETGKIKSYKDLERGEVKYEECLAKICLYKQIDQLNRYDAMMEKAIKKYNKYDKGIVVKKLPDQQMLNFLSKRYGRKSKTFVNICKQVCLHIAEQDDTIFDVWPAVKINCTDIVFVIIVKKTSNDNDMAESIRFYGKPILYSYIKRTIGEVNNEEKTVIQYVQTPGFQNETCSSGAPISQREKLERSVNRNNRTLMKEHKYLMIISGSHVRSRKFGTSEHEILIESCIVLYVFIKGYIPIQEDPFKKEYDGVPVDVREGFFELFNGPARSFHDNLKTGCQIEQHMSGTLGGFVDFPDYGTCAFTCAHVVLNPEEMKTLHQNADDMEVDSGIATGQPVYQPDKSLAKNVVGKVVKAIYREGGDAESGIEIAFFQIEERLPYLGDFPESKGQPFTEMLYDSGKIADLSKCPFIRAVYKFGAVTEWTSGIVERVTDNPTSSVKTYENFTVNQCQGHEVTLHNLTKVKSTSHHFAAQGDSGSLVFARNGIRKLVCVGVVEGGSHQSLITYVMPIFPILEQIKKTSLETFELNRVDEKFNQIIRSSRR